MTGRSRLTIDDRGQAFTLEAVTAAVLLLVSFVIAMQISGTSSLTASTDSQQIEQQQGAVVAGLLDAAVENGTLHSMVLYWNDSNGTFDGVGEKGYYVTGGGPTEFGQLLDRSFEAGDVVFNVNVIYVNNTTRQPEREIVVRQGDPTDSAVRVTRTVTLFDDDTLTGPGSFENGSAPTLANASTFYANDADTGGPLYQVVRVEVIVWRV